MTASPSFNSRKRPPPEATESTQPQKRLHTASSQESNNFSTSLLQLPNELWCLILLFVGSYDLDTLMHLSSLCRITRQKLQEPLMDYSPSAATQIGQRVASVCLDRRSRSFGKIEKKEIVLLRRFSVFAIRANCLHSLRHFASAKGGKVASSVRCLTVGSRLHFSTVYPTKNQEDLNEEAKVSVSELLSLFKQFSNVESLHIDRNYCQKLAPFMFQGASSQEPNIFPNLKKLCAVHSSPEEVIPLIEYYGPQLRYLELNSFPSHQLSVETPWLQKLVLQSTDSPIQIPDSVRHLRICGGKHSEMHQLPDKCQIQTLEIMNCSLSDDFEFPSTLKSLSLYNCSNVPPLRRAISECFICIGTCLQNWSEDDTSQLESLPVLSLQPFPSDHEMQYSMTEFLDSTAGVKVLETTLDVLLEAHEASPDYEILFLSGLVSDGILSHECADYIALPYLKEVVISSNHIDIHQLCFLIMHSPDLQHLWLPKQMKFSSFRATDPLPLLTELLFRSCYGSDVTVSVLRRFISAVMSDGKIFDDVFQNKVLLVSVLDTFKEKGTFESSLFTPQLYILLGVLDAFFFMKGCITTQKPAWTNIVRYSSMKDVYQRRREMFSKFMDVESAKFVTEEEKDSFSSQRVASMLS